MQDNFILAQLLPEADNLKRLQALLDVEKKVEAEPNAFIRLAALIPKNKQAATGLARRLKLSNRDAERLDILATLPDLLRGKLDPIPFRRAMYEHGADPVRDAALLLAADDRGADLEPAFAAAADWTKPVFPLQGGDILEFGIPAGPRVGEVLRTVEEWWLAQDFRPNRADCLTQVKKMAC